MTSEGPQPVITKDVEDYLLGVHFAKLATLNKNGSPQLTPIWYMYENGKIIVNTTRERVKFRNMLRDGRVSLLVDEGYGYVSVKGTAREAPERDANLDIEALAVRYKGAEAGRKQAREQFWKMNRVSFEITPLRVVADLG